MVEFIVPIGLIIYDAIRECVMRICEYTKTRFTLLVAGEDMAQRTTPNGKIYN